MADLAVREAKHADAENFDLSAGRGDAHEATTMRTANAPDRRDGVARRDLQLADEVDIRKKAIDLAAPRPPDWPLHPAAGEPTA